MGKKAPDFKLLDQYGNEFCLSETLTHSAALLIFYPGDFRIVCKKQLCDYRDHLQTFYMNGIQLVGISENTTEEHLKFAKDFKFPFPLLSDEKYLISKQYGCTSLLMIGGISRAVYIVNRRGIILYCYVEPTILSRRTAEVLTKVILDLKQNSLL